MDANIIQLFDTHGIDGVNIPKYGWSASLDWTPPVKCRPFVFPRLNQIYGFINSAFR